MNATVTPRRSLVHFVPPHGTWIELGVAAGCFAEEILAAHPTLNYIGVDRWSDAHNDNERLRALSRLQRFSDRHPQIRHQTFAAAVLEIPDESADVVYIDGYAHTGQENGQTLSDWWPKVKPGGVLSGHDYCEHWLPTFKAVNAFAAQQNTPIQVLNDTPYPSWFIIKPAPISVDSPTKQS
jgi:hypothetical protein